MEPRERGLRTRYRLSDQLIVPMKPGNAGGGKAKPIQPEVALIISILDDKNEEVYIIS